MADYRLPGPTDSWSQWLHTDNGCSARSANAGRGPVNGAVAGHASHWDPLVPLRRAAAVGEAYQIARLRAPAAIARATGLDDLPSLAAHVLAGLLQMALVVAASTALGAAAGAAIGALFGGVGAAPGGLAGAELGFNAGMAIITWMGLATIAVEVVRGLGQVTQLLQRGVVMAWEAEDHPAHRQMQVDAAGQLLADAMGQLMLLVMLAIVARLTASQAMASTQRAASAQAELITLLRQSRLGGEFAAWVDANSARLMRNPKLRLHNETAGRSGAGSAASTPSQLRKLPPALDQKPSPIGQRPHPRQSERDAGAALGEGARGQISYLNGKEVKYGTLGSVRPDWITDGNVASIEVKNYNLATNQAALVKNVSDQAIKRAAHLPAGMEQQILIDVRGQIVGEAQKTAIIKDIAARSQGVIAPDAITFMH